MLCTHILIPPPSGTTPGHSLLLRNSPCPFGKREKFLPFYPEVYPLGPKEVPRHEGMD